ncbi:MAG: patatin-like phospholipase family protein, partial [Anaerolineae bacterium]|nr:patatin-like phospholipase family protein [Anaerolineae bacterium]
MLSFNPNGKKVILSVDGGGMRGIIPIAMLAELEAMTGRPAYELFDMVAGTSTGAIIAGGLALHLSAHEILEQIYKSRLPGAFPPDTFLSNLATYGRFLLTGLRYLYDLEPFRQALQPLAQGQTLGDLTRPIFFATTKDVRSGDTYYVVSAGPGLSAFADWPLSGAVAASGAAPIYFPPVAGNLIDGGVGVYANPCLAVATEAMEYIGATEDFVDDNVILVSLGTGFTPRTRDDGIAARYWLFDWVNYVILSG